MQSIPARALTLLLVVVPPAGGLGAAIASWPLPLVTAAARDGWVGLREIPIEWGVIANLPKWVYAGNRLVAMGLGLAYLATMLAGFGYFGLLGGRLWGWLVVKKLRWMTEEEVQAFSSQEPRN